MPTAREGRARLFLFVVLSCACADGVPGDRASVTERPGATPRAAASTTESVRQPDAGAQPGGVRRVVSLLPAASALLVAMGASESIVGRAVDDRTPELADRPTVGTVIHADPERVRALAPDLVVLAGSTPNGHLPGLLGPSVRIRAVELARLADVAERARELGAWVGRPLSGARVATRIESALDSIGRHPVSCRPSVLWAVGQVPPIAAGPRTLPDDLVHLVGATNALGVSSVPWPRPALEALISSRADVLVWPVGGDLPPFSSLPASSPWRRVGAAHRTTVHELDAELMHEAGPDVARAARILRDRLEASCPLTPKPPLLPGP